MSDLAIKVENLSKRYRIGQKEEKHDTLAGALAYWAKRPVANWRRLRSLSKFEEELDGNPKTGDRKGNSEFEIRNSKFEIIRHPSDIIWALKDVSFEVKQGEVLGVIGRNGAGKSTLLKILARITHPTGGRVELHGRVSSLLEVGTGFHPELTGRENIYLNGTILGMSKAEIDKKFEEIVDFSGVEQFIDTPVKRYSSGMGVRLAFSVAAHLEPEILLIDEVLAVGDAEFQEKCLGKMGEVAREGQTVLFVSHNMGAVSNLCKKCIFIRNGSIQNYGEVADIINEYYGFISKPIDKVIRQGNGKARVKKVIIAKEEHENINFDVFEDIKFKIIIESYDVIKDCVIGIKLFDKLRNIIFSTNTEILGLSRINLEKGRLYEAIFTLHNVSLKNGRYDLLIGIHPKKAKSSSPHDYYDRVEDIAHFYINSDKNDYGIVNIQTDFILRNNL